MNDCGYVNDVYYSPVAAKQRFLVSCSRLRHEKIKETQFFLGANIAAELARALTILGPIDRRKRVP